MGDASGTLNLDGKEVDSLERRRHVDEPWKDGISARTNRRHQEPLRCHHAKLRGRAMYTILGATTRVFIGTATFWCTSSLLQFHSNYFECHIRPVNRFREGADLCAVGFRAVYAWMRLQEPLEPSMPPEKLVVLIHTAMQLEMPRLLALCYRLLCTERFREELAYQVYLKALKYPQLEALRKVMLQRIGTAFVAVIGGRDFVRMPLEDVMTMLQQDSLGVNTEMEVLVGIVRWLTVNAHEIASATPPLMDCLRLTLLPVAMLHKFWNRAMAPSEPDEPFMNFFRGNPAMRERISCAITVAQLQHLYRTRRGLLESCRARGFLVDMPREWLYDEDCSYHLARPSAPYCHTIHAQVVIDYALRRNERLTECAERWRRRFRRFLSPAEDLQPIAEVPEDKDEEAEVPAAPAVAPPVPGVPGAPLMSAAERLTARPSAIRRAHEAIARELQGLRMVLNALMERAHRRAELGLRLERRIRALERENSSGLQRHTIRYETNRENLYSLRVVREADLSNTYSDSDSDSDSEVQDAQEASDSYYFEHICRLRELFLPETEDPAQETAAEDVRPMESIVLNNDLMISKLLAQLDR
ncbi:uncharacterized protein LOC122624209 [Drosophila teissieri]|uniref:uncharacterized protein LOC122624209 n=1 Tax=Drosophila teissieri TaxID=7243 RepID=UPI001CBA4DE2|nr:uncharacterized protein LOC122624209 [Drosophila teissieri]